MGQNGVLFWEPGKRAEPGWGLGCRVWGLGFGVQAPGFMVWGVGYKDI